MLASFPSQHLELHRREKGNLEGSVRSRGGDGWAGLGRDLIEAGLNEPGEAV